MLGSTYSVSFSGSTQAAQFDAFEITASSGKTVELLEVHLSQVSNFSDAQERRLLVLIKSGQTVAGSGGGLPTAIPREIGAAPFSGLVKMLNPVKASGGSIVVHRALNWNIRAPLDLIFTANQTSIFIPPGGRLTIEIATTPQTPITFAGYVVVREVGTGLAPSNLPVQVPALRAQSFLDKHSVNVQIDRPTYAYSTPTTPGPLDDQCLAHLAALNIKSVRCIWRGGGSGAAGRSRDVGYDYWAARGIKFCFHTGAHGFYTGFPGLSDCIAQISAFEAAFPGAVISVEGANELNLTYSGRRKGADGYFAYTDRFGVTYSSEPAGAEMIKRQEDLLFGVRNTPNLATKPVTAYENAPNITAPNGCDFYNKHLYPNQGNPQNCTWLWKDPSTNLTHQPLYFPDYNGPFPTRMRDIYTNELAWWQGLSPAGPAPSVLHPLQMTEFGWHRLGMNQNDEHIALNIIFTWLMLALTYDRLTFYELLEGPNPATLTEDCFGLWSGAATHVMRPVAQYLINFRAALVDAGGTGFSLANTQFQLNGLPPLGHTLLLQKQNGEYLLLIWREDPYFSGGGGNGQPIAVTPVTLSINVPAGKQVQWISPMDHPTNSVLPSLGKHPLLARIF